KRRDRLHVAAVLVAERKPVQQVFDGIEPRALEIGGLSRADAFEKMERGVEGFAQGSRRVRKEPPYLMRSIERSQPGRRGRRSADSPPADRTDRRSSRPADSSRSSSSS